MRSVPASTTSPRSPASALKGAEEEVAALARIAWRALRRLGVAPDAIPDAVQDTMLVVHRRRGDFRGDSSLQTWLYGIVLRVAGEYRRKSRYQRHLFELVEAPVVDQTESIGPSPFESLERQRAAQLLHELLDQLPEPLRALFVLVELEELPLPDAARALELPLTTCKSRIKTARRLFDAGAMRQRARLDETRPGEARSSQTRTSKGAKEGTPHE